MIAKHSNGVGTSHFDLHAADDTAANKFESCNGKEVDVDLLFFPHPLCKAWLQTRTNTEMIRHLLPWVQLKLLMTHFLDLLWEHGTKHVVIYLLTDGPECIYVGQTNNLRGRLLSHKKRGIFSTDEGAFFFAPTKHHADVFEALLIHGLNPRHNATRCMSAHSLALCNHVDINFNLLDACKCGYCDNQTARKA